MTGDLGAWERDYLEAEAERDKADAEALRRAARVMKRRSKRPDSFLMGVLVKVLTNAADAIELGR